MIGDSKKKYIKNELNSGVSLKKKNSLKFDVSSAFYAEVDSIDSLRKLLGNDVVRANDIFVLGGGTNVLFSNDYHGVVIQVGIKGIEKIFEDAEYVHIEIGAGEDWPSVVEYAVSKGWGGIENLALVPGTAGAAPVQNIACYGHNLHETLLFVTAINIEDGSKKNFSCTECNFGYRTSIFKNELKSQFVIVSIILRLNKNPVLNTSYNSRYESVENELFELGDPPYTVKDVYQAIINIRQRKLPDVEKIGTVGSVFKNPLISFEQFEKIRSICPDIHCYPERQLDYSSHEQYRKEKGNKVKIPAAWLIEEMGWAGKRIGDCGIWKTQPINIVNYGNATPEEYLGFIDIVKDAVYNNYGIKLETEVVVV
ncbi:UDP-N-acetylmuramate dehydrogenase [Candidatus Electrothrix sp.]|uniref:UDP-N-acetylmuramate dehydrogenase n=1 Tax=Candidatus Electrothrix sp. TaxID=2170559 RepID=UPI0040560E9A